MPSSTQMMRPRVLRAKTRNLRPQPLSLPMALAAFPCAENHHPHVAREVADERGSNAVLPCGVSLGHQVLARARAALSSKIVSGKRAARF